MASDTPHAAPEPTADLAQVPRKAPDEAPGWTDSPVIAKGVPYVLYALAIALILIDPLVHKHGPFEIEHLWGFYGLYPLLGCTAFLLIARIVGAALRRSEDYYDR